MQDLGPRPYHEANMLARLILAGVFAVLFVPLLVLPADQATLEGLTLRSLLDRSGGLYEDLIEARGSKAAPHPLDPERTARSLRIAWPENREPAQEEHLDAVRGALRVQEVAWDSTGRAITAPLPELATSQTATTLQLSLRWDEANRMLTLEDPVGDFQTTGDIAGKTTLFPPLIAILLAFLTRSVIPSLFLGVLAGCFLLVPAGESVFQTISILIQDILWGDILSDMFYVYILGFVLLLSGTVALVTRMGGIEGMVQALTRYAKSSRSVQAIAYCLGIGIFFDDYANTMIVGNSSGPLFDRLKVSRAKLAYIVDSTAAPVAGIAILSTWVAYQISTYAPQLPTVGLDSNQGYELFLQTIPYRMYCWMALIAVGVIVFSKRDFGPMWAEEAATRRGQGSSHAKSESEQSHLQMAKSATPRWINGVLPLFVVMVGFTAFLIFYLGAEAINAAIAGGDEELRKVKAEGGAPYYRSMLANSPSTQAIFYGSLAALVVAALLALGQRLLKPVDVAVTTTRGIAVLFKDAVLILVLAWCIAKACEHLGTANYLVAVTQDLINPMMLPIILFVTSGFVAFSTGSSWATMAIMQPNVVLLAHRLGEGSEFGSLGLLILSIGAVLEGAIWGDHCSPISDTTVLSSIASRCKLLDHVRTQAPYALMVAAVALTVGYLPLAIFYDVSPWVPWICIGVGTAVLIALVRMIGKPIPEE